ncbi:hypothetical protein FOLKNPGA_01228 [Legionella sp. PC1000]|uniref:hypothetical protein n=1 Tax=Legionella sp. PC1000 TaxID=2746060 RepID=UPI0015F98B8D|nr:hypothetical protein [Legionella sp. PC1000]QLZ68450.1 hypothetical protein FOLKNPGA_01228 [Legionella sp. PC1000]
MFLRGAKYLGAATMGAGALYLTQQTVEYQSLQQKMKKMQTVPEITPAIIDAQEKNWLIFGRQSPGYVRDTEKTPKGHLHDKINATSLWIKGMGTQLDNEKHYDLFERSDFKVELFSKEEGAACVRVPPEKMLSDDLSTIKDDDLFEVGFARKQGFADITQKSPFYHSSIGLRKISEKDLPDSKFVVLTGQEIKEVIERTNKTICDPQHCDLYSSNCYSASTYATAEIIKILHERGGAVDKEDLQAVAEVLAKRALDNFGRGVSNNSVVSVQLTSSIPQILQEHGLGEALKSEKANTIKLGNSTE